MILKENKNFRKMFIVTECAALTHMSVKLVIFINITCILTSIYLLIIKCLDIYQNNEYKIMNLSSCVTHLSIKLVVFMNIKNIRQSQD